MPADALWPARLNERLGASAPAAIQTVGPVALLSAHKTALFCSVRTPGDAILRAHDAARRLRDEGVAVISGFHSPIEIECLRILLAPLVLTLVWRSHELRKADHDHSRSTP
jgi:predicted Rossmann fold nucleotide-binding protein DprA/Smf involved in DNA uptake